MRELQRQEENNNSTRQSILSTHQNVLETSSIEDLSPIRRPKTVTEDKTQFQEILRTEPEDNVKNVVSHIFIE
jgi:hypothetical protein